MRRNALITILIMVVLCLSLSGCMVKESTYLKKSAEADGLNKELIDLRQKHQVLTQERDSLLSQAKTLNGELAQEKAGFAAIKQDLQKVTADRDELDGFLKAKSDELSQAIRDLRAANAALVAENAKLKENIAKTTAENVTLAQGLQATRQAKEDLMQEMKSEVAQGQVTITELKGKLTVDLLDEILFDSGKAEMKPEGLQVMQRVIDILKNVKDKNIRIEGHTDNVPIGGALAKKYPSNWELSAARAIHVTKFLEKLGINPLVLSAAAYGEFKPMADNSTPEGRAKNRRIAIILLPKD